MPHTSNRHSKTHWIKIKNHILNLARQRYIIGLIYTFLYEFKTHIRDTPGNKFEYLIITNHVNSIQQRLLKIKQTVNITTLNFLCDRDNLNILLEFYLSVMALIEKYGGSNCISVVNIYLLLYTEIMYITQFYKPCSPRTIITNINLIDSKAGLQSPLKHDIRTITRFQTDLQPRLSSSLPDKISNIKTNSLTHFEQYESGSVAGSSSESSITSSDEDDVIIDFNTLDKRNLCTPTLNDNKLPSNSAIKTKLPFYSANEPITNLTISNTVGVGLQSHVNVDSTLQTNTNILEPVYALYNKWLLTLCKTKPINPTLTLPATIKNYITNNKPANIQYLALINSIIRPIEVNVFTVCTVCTGLLAQCACDSMSTQIKSIYTHLENIICAAGGQFKKPDRTVLLGHVNRVKDTVPMVYPAYLENLGPLVKNNIYIGNISNQGVISTIKNYEIIKDNLVHVIISIGPGLYIVINGHIENQDLLLVQKYPVLQQKFELIQQHIISISDLNMHYKKLIIKTLSLKQVLCSSVTDIIKFTYDCWNLYMITMAQSLNDMTTGFINSAPRTKYNVINSLLLNHTNCDALFRAQLLWNLLVDEYNMSSQQTDIFNKLHPELQCILTNIFTNIDTECANVFPKKPSLDQLTYETQIETSNADTQTKQKMLDKLKEINNKNNDNSSKAQQYLDGILTIPFGKYAREAIIQETDHYDHRIILFVTNLIILCIDNSIDYAMCTEFLTVCGQVLNISSATISSLHNIDDETLLESVIIKLLSPSKIIPGQGWSGTPRPGQLKQLLAGMTELIAQRLPITPEAIDTFYIRTMLDHIDPYHINDIINSYNDIASTNNVKTIQDLLDQIDNDSSSNNKQLLLSILIQDGHFIDAGYPYILDIYSSQLDGLIQEHYLLQIKKRDYLSACYTRLDESIYGQHEAKNQILRILGQWLNGNQGGYCLGFEGSPGIGKTSLAKFGISRALVDVDGNSRPFGFIALGGSSNGSTLEGHSYTYVGSTWGRIVDILITSKCMNPIIFIDELDKISNTESGRELIGILTHLTDKTQNNEFTDKYFAGVKIDLSQVLFIFSYNDYAKLDNILADRIHRIQFDNYTNKDKLAICKDYLIPNISSEINITDFEPRFEPDVLNYLIDFYTHEAGVRKLKEKLYDILREINIRHIRGEITCSAEKDKLIITRDTVDDILSTYYKIDIAKPFSDAHVGIVYGLYATSMGTGGITIIQVTNKYIDSGSTLLFTGKPGDVMQESMRVSLTLAANILPKPVLEKWGILDSSSSTKPKFGVHIHCPDGSTPKDGPSAGCAFTLGLISLLTGIPVKNTISMTGEIDIMGRVLPIGGLDSKIQGSSRAGIFSILVPVDNKRDIDRIKIKQPEILVGVTIIFTTTIQDVIDHGLVSAIPI